MTRDSLHYLIAGLSVETGIPHSEFINMERPMLLATVKYMQDKAKAVKNANRSKRAY